MKRLITILLIFIMLTSAIGCSETVEVVNDEEKEITIIMTNHNIMHQHNGLELLAREAQVYINHLNMFIDEFTEKTGIKVNVVDYLGNTYEEYLQIRNSQLYLQDGPTLILIAAGEGYKELIEEGAALKVDEKLKNYENVYESLRNGYYVPMAMAVEPYMMHIAALKNLGLTIPHFNWNYKDFHSIMNTYFENYSGYILPEAVKLTIATALEDIGPLLKEEGRSQLANHEMVEIIEGIRDILLESERYKKIEGYTYENYYSMLFNLKGDGNHEEYGKYVEILYAASGNIPHLHLWRSTNSLNSLETSKNISEYLYYFNTQGSHIEIEDTILLPKPYPLYSSWGFIVNSNGKNVSEGLEFLNFLLSNESQLRVFTDINDEHNSRRFLSFSYPVVKTIKDEIARVEKEEEIDQHLIELRKTVLGQIERGERKRGLKGADEMYITEILEGNPAIHRDELYKLIVKIVFADDPYTSDEIMRELREFDNMMNIRFSE